MSCTNRLMDTNHVSTTKKNMRFNMKSIMKRSVIKRSNVQSIVFALLLLPFISSCNEFEVFEITKVKTLEVSSVNTTQALVEGEIISIGKLPITDHGFVWSMSESINSDDENKSSLGTINKTGTFSHNMEGLMPSKVYYVRAYVQYGNGILYGSAQRFTTIKP